MREIVACAAPGADALRIVDTLVGSLSGQRSQAPNVRIVVQRIPGTVPKNRETLHWISPITTYEIARRRGVIMVCSMSASSEMDGQSSQQAAVQRIESAPAIKQTKSTEKISNPTGKVGVPNLAEPTPHRHVLNRQFYLFLQDSRRCNGPAHHLFSGR
ncbi:hypothetical protein QIH80_33730 [Bradyrhizobium elkanii]|nr:hypothetical protein QIH80_33730 [Bradyrhizobium elkanii]